MDKIKLKVDRPENLLIKHIKIILFNIFAGVFNWFVILICLIILGSAYWWLIRPKYNFIASDQEMTFREKEYEEKVDYLKQLNEVKNLYRAINQADKDKIDLILSANQDLDRLKIVLLREVDKVGKEKGVTIDDVVITPLDNSASKMIKINETDKKKPSFDKLRLVQVAFTAKNINYDQLKKFLARLETSLRVMDVTDLNFDPKSREAGIKLLAYHLDQ